MLNAEKENSEKKIEIQQNENAKKADSNRIYFDSANALLEASKVIGEENTLWQKGLAIAQATINSFLAGSEILKDPFFVGRPWERVIAMSSVIATGLANVASIVKTKVNNKSNSNGQSIQAPTINVHQLTPRSTQDVRVVGNTQQNQDPIRAYIVSKDISQWQENENQAKQNSEY
ncbi:hypothetical protein [Sphingobacterium daejeonense]|uniref:hypothetical protein n=1 Tax=Sphingobacterium daejeonense TaxID=371142 RepID=UPI0010C2CC70|nr:hypothetical protein [Sphingobacterium daejeonense]VTP97756.1 Uncharacterised protein [Sphingobacterium daejeonense]